MYLFLYSGTLELRKAICQFHKSFPTGIPDDHLSVDNIVTADGSKVLIYLIMAVTDAGLVCWLWNVKLCWFAQNADSAPVCSTVLLLKSPSWTTYGPQCLLSKVSKTAIIDTSFDTEWKITPQALRAVRTRYDTCKSSRCFRSPSTWLASLFRRSKILKSRTGIRYWFSTTLVTRVRMYLLLELWLACQVFHTAGQ